MATPTRLLFATFQPKGFSASESSWTTRYMISHPAVASNFHACKENPEEAGKQREHMVFENGV
jgi:hypothetical protein